MRALANTADVQRRAAPRTRMIVYPANQLEPPIVPFLLNGCTAQ